jgi:histone acetyltransferase
MIQEQSGEAQFKVVDNDGSDMSLILLTGLKNIFQRQLPNMPREYISRLVYDKYDSAYPGTIRVWLS